MRIALFHELQFGGALKAVQGYGKFLKKNYTVDLYYVAETEDEDAKDNFNNVAFFKFVEKKWRGKAWKDKLYKDTYELLNLSMLHKRIASIIDKQKYDVVFVHPSRFTQSPFLLFFLKTKSIYYCQEPMRIVYDPFFYNQRFIGFPKNIYEKAVRLLRKNIDKINIAKASLVLANSEFSKKNIKNAYNIDAFVCYLGVDTSFFEPKQNEKKYDVLFIGDKEEIDGYPIFLKIKRLLPEDTRFFEVTREQGVPQIDERRLVNVYNSSKLLLVLSHNEPFGLIALEAMACGLPVVAVSEGGFNETVKSGITGFLVKRDPLQISKIIIKLIHDEALRRKMCHNARENAQVDWTWNKSVECFITYAKELA